ncbi:MAG TPA: aspartyl/asparaginyl beta-hydroxylase domain-containing protein [Urbifossiella sp.]|nr:aspartyl/asparaginyl beta-hydroxylase domain-containing protein [Urbifossiella sp.]
MKFSAVRDTMGIPLACVGIMYLLSFSYLYQRCHDRLPLKKYLSNHALLLSPVNFVFTFFSRGGGRKPVFAPATVPGLELITQNFDAIRDEARTLLDAGVFQRPPAVDEPGYNSFEKGGWRRYPIKWYSSSCRAAAVSECPRTCSVLAKVPAIRSAMFVVLPAGGRIGRHHDPLATSLRYHIGLVTPNSEKCALTLDGEAHPWHDGKELLFDQTFLHSAVNETDQARVILFCDVDNPNLPWGVKHLGGAVNSLVVAKMTGAGDRGKLSWVSAVYRPVYRVRAFVKQKIRPRSLFLYNVVKFAAIGAGLLFAVAILYLLTTVLPGD